MAACWGWQHAWCYLHSAAREAGGVIPGLPRALPEAQVPVWRLDGVGITHRATCIVQHAKRAGGHNAHLGLRPRHKCLCGGLLGVCSTHSADREAGWGHNAHLGLCSRHKCLYGGWLRLGYSYVQTAKRAEWLGYPHGATCIVQTAKRAGGHKCLCGGWLGVGITHSATCIVQHAKRAGGHNAHLGLCPRHKCLRGGLLYLGNPYSADREAGWGHQAHLGPRPRHGV